MSNLCTYLLDPKPLFIPSLDLFLTLEEMCMVLQGRQQQGLQTFLLFHIGRGEQETRYWAKLPYISEDLHSFMTTFAADWRRMRVSRTIDAIRRSAIRRAQRNALCARLNAITDFDAAAYADFQERRRISSAMLQGMWELARTANAEYLEIVSHPWG